MIGAGPTQAVMSAVLPSAIRQHDFSQPWPNSNPDMAALKYGPSRHTWHQASDKHWYLQSSSVEDPDVQLFSQWFHRAGQSRVRAMVRPVEVGITERQSELAQQPATPVGGEKKDRTSEFPMVVNALGL